MQIPLPLIAGLSLVILAMLPAASETLQLEQSGGVYMLPVRINDAVTVPFILDSGAAEVVITEDVFSVLRRAGTISRSDFIGTGTYTLAGGATVSSDLYVLHKMSVGDHVVTDVVSTVLSVKGDPLLGQSFLQKLPSWTLDNAQHALVLHDDAGRAGEQPQTAARTPTPLPERNGSVRPLWPKRNSVYIATSSEGVPVFPRTLCGYRSDAGQDFWGRPFPSKGTMRIFKGEDWQGLRQFPNTMNGCSSGIFMIRWRSSNPEVIVQSSARYSGKVPGSVKSGAFGYISGDNCEQPMFRLWGTVKQNMSTLVDIYYELKFWQAAP